ncbi:type I polyketide synthase [Tengunoibacter tsumagoiensis]|uniref:Phenolphthiocerol/phthiocerol polyketide synthase subunit E n=1 Tax=Tengunoibacter tsumagoiensis TaxID=2014871 RepID=A0A402A9J9_9CHLR|nr:type I polyketide synthase [Tengunoibacter tsumagoiensis]GCE15768.1 hypothetical protein KTT_56270 [Tengunoibacter tsumagoiensis]
MTSSTSYDSAYSNALAIVGLSGRFPGAGDVETFWENIATGIKSIRRFTSEELERAGVDPALLNDPNYVKAGTMVENLDQFDASFFGFTPREAEIMDPQHRLFLECAWEALEGAAYATEKGKGLVGVFAGSGFCSYLLNNLYGNPEVMELAGKLQIAVGNERDSLASTVSYKLNLKGPSIAVQTFCSTSLVAVHLASQSLLNYECDIALAGGVAITVPQESGYLYENGGIVSPDGECRTFDAQAQGSVMGNGIGVVALKRFEEAVEDGDHIYAIIRGSAVNNDGSVRVGYTAPGLDGQSEVIAEAIGNAGVPIESINYLEAHGTATMLGDAIELAAMIKAFRLSTDAKQFCAIGSVKPNIGHLDRASGVTGLIKTSLALYHKLLPPSLNFQQANADIDLGNSPFYVNTRPTFWSQNGAPRRAGVSSFGLGGTNAHVVLEEAPERMSSDSAHSEHLLLLSAKSEAALQDAADNLVRHLQRHPEQNLADVAYTLQIGRNAFNHRLAVVGKDHADTIAALQSRAPQRVLTANQTLRDRPVAWLFAGVGEQYIGMGRELYEQESAFRQIVDECCELARPWIGLDLRTLLFPAEEADKEAQTGLDLRSLLGRNGAKPIPQSEAEQRLQQTQYAQPAIFIIEYALAQLLLSWGYQPQALLGYSLGEYVVAAVSGVIALPDALQLVARRAQLISTLPKSSMLAVTLPQDAVQPYLSDQIQLAIVNSPQQSVLAGSTEAIEQLEARLNEQGISYRRLQTSHAFHSAQMEPIRRELIKLVASFTLQAPQIPYLSNVTGTWITDQQAQDATYWGRHLCETVYFAQGVQQLWEQSHPVLLEIGPGRSLASFAHQQLASVLTEETPLTIIPTLRARQETGSALTVFLEAIGKLWLAGVTSDWQRYWNQEQRLLVPLPTYPFQRQRYWIDAPKKASAQGITSGSKSEKKPIKYSDPADWFYIPTWQKASLAPDGATTSRGPWLFLLDETGWLEPLAQSLEAQGEHVIRVSIGARYEQVAERSYRLPAGQHEIFEILGQQLHTLNQRPATIVHGWSIASTIFEHLTPATVRTQQNPGLYSLLWLIQALEAIGDSEPLQVIVVTNQTQSVSGTENLHPEHAPLVASCKVLTQEYLNITARVIDSVFALDADAEERARQQKLLLAELCAPASSPLVAYRDGQRYEQHFQHIALAAPVTQSRLRQQGVYLITGGLGGVGQLLAEHLARTVQARLVLLSRSALPERSTWARWLDEHTEAERTSLLIRQVQHWEELGASVLVLKADVADSSQLEQAIATAIAHFGALHGVIHAAGISDEKAFGGLQEASRDIFEQHFQPKVYGLLALEQALQKQKLDFCVLFSSLSAILGGLGFAAYTAANAFIDAYTYRHNQSSTTPWLSINWDMWHVKEQAHGVLGATIEVYEMTPAEGIDAFLRVLHTSNYAQIVNSTGNLEDRIRQWIRLETLEETEPTPDASVKIENTTRAAIPTRDDYEQRLIEIWKQILGVPQVGLHDNFFDLGGNSLMGLQLLSRIKKIFKVQIPAVALFEAPTISALASYLRPSTSNVPTAQQDLLEQRRQQARLQVGTEGIAIIGMTGRFPGSDTLEQFWQNLHDGIESISVFTDEELLAAGVAPEVFRQPNYVRARPVLNDVEHFDASFFGYSPREAEMMDPQHRLFLECCWEAVEHSGYDSLSYEGLIGVFGGTNISTYMYGLLAQPEIMNSANNYQLVIGNDKDSLTTAVSYKLNLKGPSFAVQTFCSTSLVATHLASRSLLNGECDIALAGGVSIHIPVKEGHLYHQGGQESPDGHCRTFDARAKGSMFGDGVGVIVLKRLSDALADGDTIHAVIKGSAINNDGSLKVSYTAPSVIGQAQVVSTALQVAGVSADSISYIEAHGTATELGDPIEVASLTRAFRQQTDQVGYCAIGSVKTNIGHLDRAAGVSGLLKTVLALKHEQIPATLHYEAPNPEIDFETSPFFVNARLRPWPRSTAPRRAGVNSLGMGGTNVHIVVEEAPIQPATGPSRPWQLLPLSARTPEALAQARTNLHTALTQGTDPLADVAYTLQRGRHRFEYRNLVLARSTEDAITLLEATGSDGKQQWSLVGDDKERPVAWLFAGVGEQYVGMGRALYQAEPLFQQIVDQGAELARPWLELDLRTLLFPTGEEATTTAGLDLRALLGRNGATPAPQSEAEQRLQQTQYAQPAVFLIEYALAQLLLSWGIRPQALLGYSLGEYVAAAVAGVLSLPDALHLVCRRAQLIASLPESRLLAVALGQAEATPYLSEEIDLAIINSPQQCVLAGTIEAIAELEARLSEQGISHRRVQTSHAFHSRQLAGIRDELNELAAGFSVQLPSIPYISNVTGDWISEQELFDGEYWGRHLCETVHFARGIQTLWEQGNPLLMEIGAGHSLGSFVHQQISATSESEPGATVITTLRARQERQEDQAVLLAAVGKLWLAGGTIDWSQFWSKEVRRRIPLPTYPFQRQRYWIEPKKLAPTQTATKALSPMDAISGNDMDRFSDITDWFSVPSWKQSIPLMPFDIDVPAPENRCWVVFIDGCGIGLALKERLEQYQQKVVTVIPGREFTHKVAGNYSVRPGERADYNALLKHLREQGLHPDRLIHAWTVTDNFNIDRETEEFATRIIELGFYSLMALTQALGDQDLAGCEISAISNHLQDVTGTDCICPAKATIIGPCRVIAQEYTTIRCRSIDITLPRPGSWSEDQLLDQLLGELTQPELSDRMVAFRGVHRWVQTFAPVKLQHKSKPAPILRKNGVYLILGGLGGIGLAVAAHLFHTQQAKLVLTSRSGLPPRQSWERILQEHGDEAGIGRQVRQILDLESEGAQILTLAADVTDEGQMAQVIKTTTQTFGPLNGVIQAAGLPPSGVIQLKTPEMAARVLAPKVRGTMVLERALEGQQLDFLVIFSSMSSTTAGPGQIDYCAANAFLDAYARKNHARHGVTLAIDWGEWQWDAWQSGLQGFPEEAQAYFKERRLKFGIDFPDGMEAFERILTYRLPQVYVSPLDFQWLVAGSKDFSISVIVQKIQEYRQLASLAYARPKLMTEYIAPESEIECAMAKIWTELLGIEQIGVNDNFFELGGHSLMGTQLISRLRQHFQVNLPLSALFEAPTIGDLSLAVEVTILEEIENMSEEEVQRLV